MSVPVRARRCTSRHPAPSRMVSVDSETSAAGSRRRRSSPRSSNSSTSSATAWHDDAFRAEYAELLGSYAGRPTPVTECHRLSERLGLRVLRQARGPDPHRVAQDQQRARAGAAHPPHGQAPRDRGDGRRSARRRDRHRRRALRSRVHGLHGCGRRRTPGAQRVAHAAARFRGRAGGVGERDAEGRRQRGDARVGRERRVDALLPRLRDGAAPVPVDGARVPTRHRRRGTRSSAGRCSTVPIPSSWSRASAADRTRSAPSPPSSTPTPD